MESWKVSLQYAIFESVPSYTIQPAAIVRILNIKADAIRKYCRAIYGPCYALFMVGKVIDCGG